LRRALSTFPSQKAHLVTAAHCECFSAFCNTRGTLGQPSGKEGTGLVPRSGSNMQRRRHG
jgi:hypothetical protein